MLHRDLYGASWLLRAILTATIVATSVGGASAVQLGDLSGSWQLLVDDYLLDQKTNVARTYHAFEKSGDSPVLVADRPWESGFVYMYGTVLPGEDGSGYRMWYHAYDGTYRNLYATSQDGVHWEKPSLGIVSYNGSTDNNLFIQRSSEDHLPQVIHTPWDAPDAQYKLVAYDYDMRGFRGATSVDGIHFADVSGNPILPNYGDVGNFVWDPHAQQYYGTPKVMASVRGYTRRSVGVSMTGDFTDWPAAQTVLVPDQIDDYWVAGGGQHTDFYGLSAFAYESGYLGFLWVFHITDGGNDGPIWPELVSSRDGVHWTRQEANAEGYRTPLLSLGAAGAWDDGMIFTPNHPLVEGDTVRLYYGGIDDTHGYPNKPTHGAIGLATLRKDGFASLDASETPGSVTTKPLANVGGPLRVNASAAGGWLRVEVLDAAGQVVPGYSLADCQPVSADGVDLAVTWAARTELPQSDSPLRLRFVYSNASLYSFMAGQGVDLPAIPLVGTLDGRGALFTFEGDAGYKVTDKLVADGSQDPMVLGDVAVVDDPARAAFGRGSVSFPDSPSVGSLLAIPDTADLGKAFTLAAMVDETGENFSRLFSSFDGGTPATNELVFDVDPSGKHPTVLGVRAIVHGAYVTRPAQFDDDQYHHLAMTYRDGRLRLYLDGVQLGDEAVVPGGAVQLTYDLHFGEDYSPSSQVNEPFEGRADDILVFRQPLAPSRIQALARNGAEVFFSQPLGSRYTAEGDGARATDAKTHDGAQNGAFRGGVSIDLDPARARLGSRSFALAAGAELGTIELADSSYLGDRFTLAAFIQADRTGRQRLFSAYDGAGTVGTDELVFDFDPAGGGSTNGLRAILNGGTVMAGDPVTFSLGKYHHLAMTFDAGEILLFLDGEVVASGQVSLAPVSLARNLFFGEDSAGTASEQFVGHADEILLLGDALSLGAIAWLAHPEWGLLPGDANGDGAVDDLDASILAAHWQQSGGANWGDADFNGDGAVNDLDASILAAHWQATLDGSAAVPEPSAAAMVGILLAALALGRANGRSLLAGGVSRKP